MLLFNITTGLQIKASNAIRGLSLNKYILMYLTASCFLVCSVHIFYVEVPMLVL